MLFLRLWPVWGGDSVRAADTIWADVILNASPVQTAGQTVPHVHVHLIPRYCGDMDNPEGGVRGVIPEKRIYRKSG